MSPYPVALVCVAVFVVASCATQPTPSTATTSTPGGTAPAATSTEQARPDLVATSYAAESVRHSGGDLVYADWRIITTLNPYYAREAADVRAAAPALLGLLNVTPDLKWVGFPHMAISDVVPLTTNGGVAVTASGMDVRYQIHQGLRWSDESRITCADVEATWRWVVDPAQRGLVNGGPREGMAGWEDITSVTDAGEGACLVHFSKPYEGYLSLFSPLLPKAYLESVAVPDAPERLYALTDVAAGVYSGPYLPTAYSPGSVLEYAPNPAYWEVTGKTRGFDALRIRYYPEDRFALEAGFDKGEFDVGTGLTHLDLADLADRVPCSGPGTPSGCQLVLEDSFTYEQLSFQARSLARKFGQDSVAPVKQALALAVDKQAIVDDVLGGTVAPLGRNDQSPLFWWYQPAPPAVFDPEQAGSLLDIAGWVRGPEGWREKAGVPLALDYCTTTVPRARADTVSLLATRAADIGVRVTPIVVPNDPDFSGSWDQVAVDTPCNLTRGTFDVAEFASTAPFDPQVAAPAYTCAGIPEDSPQHVGRNVTRTCDASLDAAWETVRSSVDPLVIRDAMAKIQRYYVDHIVEIPLYAWRSVYLVDPTLHNAWANPMPRGILWNVDDQWSDAQAAPAG